MKSKSVKLIFMLKKMVVNIFVILFWFSIGCTLSIFLIYYTLDVITYLYIKIMKSNYSLFQWAYPLLLILIFSFVATLLIQKKCKLFESYRKYSSIMLVFIIIYLVIILISHIFEIELPLWFTSLFRIAI